MKHSLLTLAALIMLAQPTPPTPEPTRIGVPFPIPTATQVTPEPPTPTRIGVPMPTFTTYVPMVKR